jgi:RHS repeat-associated protein
MTSGGSTIYTETFSYDEWDRVGQRSWTRDGRTYTIEYEYNTAGQLTKLTYPSGRQVGINHDGNGRLVSMTEPNGGTPVPTYISNITYNPAGQVTGTSLGNGVNETFGYDGNRLQLTSQTATKASTSLMNLTYGYQATAGQMGAGTTAGNSGQLVSISGTINGTTESAAYSYDNLGRLVTSSQTSNGQSAQRRFGYDRWGNRTGMWDAVSGGNQIQSIALVQSGGAPTNQIQSVTSGGATKNYVYDAAGNVTNDGTHTYAYDAENRLVTVDGGSTGQYFYDYENRRVKKVVGSSSTHCTWEGSQVLCEYNAATGAQIIDYVYCGSRLLAEGPGSTIGGNSPVTYPKSDRISVRMLLDKFGTLVGLQAHLPFGADFAESGAQEKHHFTSYYRDGEVGLDYAVNRVYSAVLGRFQSVDPYEGSARLCSTQSWNRFSYVQNEPIDQGDPLGLDGIDNPYEIPHAGDNHQHGDCPAWQHSCDLTSGFSIGILDGSGGGCYNGFSEGGGPCFPRPPPVVSSGSIQPRTSGKPRSGIPPLTDVNTDPNISLGPQENPVEDGYWYFFFEVAVSLPSGARSPVFWRFNQSVLRNERVTIEWEGRLLTEQRLPMFDATDEGVAENPLFSRTSGGLHYWIDLPSTRKKQKVLGKTGLVVSLNLSLEFQLTANYSRDPRRSCSRKFTLSLTVESRNPEWTP